MRASTLRAVSIFATLTGGTLSGCGPGQSADEGQADDSGTTTAGPDTSETNDDLDTGVLESCYEHEEDSCPDPWPILQCEGTDPVCATLTYDSEVGLDADAAMALECILAGLRDKTVGVYRVEDTYVEGPRSLYIQMLPSGNALIARQDNNFGCTYSETVGAIPPASVVQDTCIEGGVLTVDTVEDCVFNLSQSCAYYVGSACD